MNLLNSLIVGLLSGVVAAFIFHLYLRYIVPKVEFSDFIATNTININGISVKRFSFKFLNKCRWRVIYNIKATVFIDIPEHITWGVSTRRITVVERDLPRLSIFNKHDTEASYAAVLEIPKTSAAIQETLDCKLGETFFDCWDRNYQANSGTRAGIIIVASDGFSGQTRVYQKIYEGFGAVIKQGRFKPGPTFEII